MNIGYGSNSCSRGNWLVFLTYAVKSLSPLFIRHIFFRFLKGDVRYPNLALSRTAFQSSTKGGAVATRAVDGNTDNRFSMWSCTHTFFQISPWWMVDLGRLVNVNRVIITNRQNEGKNISHKLLWRNPWLISIFITDTYYKMMVMLACCFTFWSWWWWRWLSDSCEDDDDIIHSLLSTYSLTYS